MDLVQRDQWLRVRHVLPWWEPDPGAWPSVVTNGQMGAAGPFRVPKALPAPQVDGRGDPGGEKVHRGLEGSGAAALRAKETSHHGHAPSSDTHCQGHGAAGLQTALCVVPQLMSSGAVGGKPHRKTCVGSLAGSLSLRSCPGPVHCERLKSAGKGPRGHLP